MTVEVSGMDWALKFPVTVVVIAKKKERCQHGLRGRVLTPKQTNHHLRREPKMTTNEVIGNLENKAFHGSAWNQKKLTAAEQVIIETEWTDYLLKLVGLGNTHILKNFRYRLVMEDTGEED